MSISDTWCCGTGTCLDTVYSSICQSITDNNAIDCVGEWSYSTCSISCGGGVRTRTFHVVQPAANGGVECVYIDGTTETLTCNTPPCSTDCIGEWSMYSMCSLSCGGGTKSRIYTVVQAAANGGATCPHADGQVEQVGCNAIDCAVIGCTVVSGGEQFGVTVNNSCEPCITDQTWWPCNTVYCDCKAGECVAGWSERSGCDTTCGSGTQFRRYDIQNASPTCVLADGTLETRSCSMEEFILSTQPPTQKPSATQPTLSISQPTTILSTKQPTTTQPTTRQPTEQHTTNSQPTTT